MSSETISVFKCYRCFREWDDYETDRKFRLRKCSVCHLEICKSCFYNPMSKQHCFKCSLDKPPKRDNKCITNRLVHHHIYK